MMAHSLHKGYDPGTDRKQANHRPSLTQFSTYSGTLHIALKKLLENKAFGKTRLKNSESFWTPIFTGNAILFNFKSKANSQKIYAKVRL